MSYFTAALTVAHLFNKSIYRLPKAKLTFNLHLNQYLCKYAFDSAGCILPIYPLRTWIFYVPRNALCKMTQSVPTVPLSCDISVLEFQYALFRPRGKQNHFCIVRNILHAQWLLIVFGCAANLKAWREYHSVSSQARANIYGMLNFI